MLIVNLCEYSAFMHPMYGEIAECVCVPFGWMTAPIHTYRHTHIQTYKHAYRQHIQTYIQTHKHTNIHIDIHTNIHTYI